MKRPNQIDPRITQKVIEMVASHHGITPEEMVHGDHARARYLVIYILREVGATMQTCSDAVGLKTIGSVAIACKTIQKMMSQDPALVAKIEEIKAEVLMMAAIPAPEGQLQPERQVLVVLPQPPSQVTQVVTASAASSPKTIEKVRKAVTSTFLGENLLQSMDAATDLRLAKDVLAFIVWEEANQTPLPATLSSLGISQEDLYTAVGRITVTLKHDDGFRKKFKATRNAALSS